MGWGKVACWNRKAAISLKRVGIEETLLLEITNALSNSTIPDPYGLLFPKIGVCNPTHNSNRQSLLSRERLKLRTSNLARTIIGSIRTKPIKNFGEKGAWAYPGSGTVQIFWVPILSQERAKLRTSNFVRTFIGSIATKAH